MIPDGGVLNITIYRRIKHALGGEIAFKGFPSSDRYGINISVCDGLAIMNNSTNKEGAWDFIQFTLDEDIQVQMQAGFPVRLSAFDKFLEECVNLYSNTITGESWHVDYGSFTHDDVDKIKKAIEHASSNTITSIDQSLILLISDIISESAEDYFNGLISADDAAYIIQNRVMRIVSEQS